MMLEGLLCSFISSRCICSVNWGVDSRFGRVTVNQVPGPERKKNNDSIVIS